MFADMELENENSPRICADIIFLTQVRWSITSKRAYQIR